MGKTSLVREFRERLPAGTAFRLGRCLSYGRSVTYSALADVLRAGTRPAPGGLGRRHVGAARRPRDPRPYARSRRRRRSRAAGGASAAAGPVGEPDLAARRAGACGRWSSRICTGRPNRWSRCSSACSRTRQGPGPSARDHAARAGCIPGGGHAEPGTPRRRGGDRARRGRARGPTRVARTGAGRRPRGGKPVLRRGGARGSPRQRAARAEKRRLVAARRRASISASRTPFRASSPPASTCSRPRRRRRSRPPR